MQRWQEELAKCTVACVVITAIWLTYSLFCLTPTLNPERLFWIQVAKSVALTALLLSFAVYASRQSILHRISERKARSFFLQVQAFDPFIAALPEETPRHAMKEELSKRIFGPEESAEAPLAMNRSEFKGIKTMIGLLGDLKSTIIGK